MLGKKKEKQNNNPYSNLRAADAQYFVKLDEKIALAQKQNKKEFCEFLIDKKQFDINYINVKSNNKIGKIDLLPSSLLSILNARDNEKAFENYKKDTMKIAKLLFDDDMTIQQICATACEFVRLSTANFDRYESESVQKPQSALCQLVSTNAYGMLSFYFGVSNAIDQTEFLAWLINLGLDIKHSLSYAECVIDSYGNPICHIVEFNGKLGVSFINYVGVAKAYTKKIETLTGLCQFIDFTEEIENGKKRALKVLSRYVPSKLMIKDRDIENALTSMAQIAYKNMSDVTASELNMLSRFDNKIWKFSSLCELLLYENNIDYEVILDLFVETQYALKLKVGDEGKFKVFPNKVIDEEYNLNEPKIYILNKMAKNNSMSHDDELFSERIESIGRESGQSADELSLDDLEPMSATDVLSRLNVKFTPKQNEGLSFENGSFKFNDDELNEVFDLSSVTQVDFSKADAEQKMLESSMGIAAEPTQSNAPPKRKGFFELLDEMSEKTKKNKARRLQEEYERLERNHQLKTPEEIAAEQNAIAKNGNIRAENDSIPDQNDNIVVKNNNITEKNSKQSERIFNAPAQDDGIYSQDDKVYLQDYIVPTQNESRHNNENVATQRNDVIEENIIEPKQAADVHMQDNVTLEKDAAAKQGSPEKSDIAPVQKQFDNLLEPKSADNLPTQDDDGENYDAINAINQEFYQAENEQSNSDDDGEDSKNDENEEVEESNEDTIENSIYGDILQFSDYNYYDRTKESLETEDDVAEGIEDKAESFAQQAAPTNENLTTQENKEEPQQEAQRESKNEPKEELQREVAAEKSKEKPVQEIKVEKNVQVKEVKPVEEIKVIESSKPSKQVKNRQSVKQVEKAKKVSTPAVAQKSAATKAPRAFAPPIPKRKPAPPLPKRKK